MDDSIRNKPRQHRSIRLSDRQIDQLLDSLDETDAEFYKKGAEDRRYRFRLNNLPLHLQSQGASSAGTGEQQAVQCVPSRWLSASSIAFLYGNYVHAGTRFTTKLMTLYGSCVMVEGSVTKCRHANGCVHEILGRFDNAIDPALFCPEATSFRVLLADDDKLVARLATHQLSELNATVELAENGRVAVEKALDSHFDLILMDIDMPEMTGTEAVAALRAKGYSGVIAAFSGQAGPDAHFLELGFDRRLVKPFTAKDLEKLLNSLRCQEPVFSRFHDDDSMRDFINEFISDLPATIQKIETAKVEANKVQLAALAVGLKEGGACYGFDAISEAAELVEQALARDAKDDELHALVDRFVKLCRQARGAKEPEPVASDA